MKDSANFAGARFMESFESRHSDHSFTKRLGDAVGIQAPPLRLDSQAKYGGALLQGVQWCCCCLARLAFDSAGVAIRRPHFFWYWHVRA